MYVIGKLGIWGREMKEDKGQQGCRKNGNIMNKNEEKWQE